MNVNACLASILFSPALALAAACEVPDFEAFAPRDTGRPTTESVSVEISMQPIAVLKIPDGFSKWGASPDGSIVFGDHPKGMTGGIGYETEQTVSVHKRGVAPANFFLSIFRGLDETGCQYMKGQRLADQDFRLYAKLEKGGELFAYGTGTRHHFYVIRHDSPAYVLSGLFKNISRAEFESILSTIRIQ